MIAIFCCLATPTFAQEVAVSTGYDSLYIFRGEKIQLDSFWVQNDIDMPVSELFSVGLSTWFEKPVKSKFIELDVSPYLNFEKDNLEASLTWAHYNYPQGSDGELSAPFNENEIQAYVAYTLWDMLSPFLQYSYNFKREGTYLEGGLSAEYALHEKFTLKGTALLGYGSRYFTESGFSHLGVTLTGEFA